MHGMESFKDNSH